jgi:hypothetical protein
VLCQVEACARRPLRTIGTSACYRLATVSCLRYSR